MPFLFFVRVFRGNSFDVVMSAEHLGVVVVNHSLDLSLEAVVFMSQRSFHVDVVVRRMIQFRLQLGN